jgi:hypothetical protein
MYGKPMMEKSGMPMMGGKLGKKAGLSIALLKAKKKKKGVKKVMPKWSDNV